MKRYLPLALLLACEPPASPPQQAPAPPSHETTTAPGPTAEVTHAEPPSHDPQAPLVVHLRGPDHPGAPGVAKLDLTLERRLVDDVPMVLTAQLPPGARLLSGLATETLVDTTHATLTRSLTVAFDTLPTDDLVVTVDARAPGRGVHAVATYRFGRPAPALPRPHDGATVLPGIPGRPIAVKPR